MDTPVGCPHYLAGAGGEGDLQIAGKTLHIASPSGCSTRSLLSRAFAADRDLKPRSRYPMST